MTVTRRFQGEADYNDGKFAEVKTIGIEGLEEGLWLGTMQIHRAQTECTADEFRERYPVGMLMQVVMTTEIRPGSQSALDFSKCLSGVPKQ